MSELTKQDIKYLMKRYGISRDELADEVKRSPSTVSVWLKDGRSLNLNILNDGIYEILGRKGARDVCLQMNSVKTY